jgi:hypothetical protein
MSTNRLLLGARQQQERQRHHIAHHAGEDQQHPGEQGAQAVQHGITERLAGLKRGKQATEHGHLFFLDQSPAGKRGQDQPQQQPPADRAGEFRQHENFQRRETE